MSDTIDPARDERRSDRGFFGQPFALANLFGVEMWERFSFYGMQGILIYYLYYSASEGGLGIAESSATSIVGAYGGTVYLSTILGAWIADRLLGSERTLFYSAILVMLGHIALAVFPGLWGVGIGLVCVAFGSGGSRPTPPPWSAICTTSTTSAATPDSPSSTWASTSARSSAHC